MAWPGLPASHKITVIGLAVLLLGSAVVAVIILGPRTEEPYSGASRPTPQVSAATSSRQAAGAPSDSASGAVGPSRSAARETTTVAAPSPRRPKKSKFIAWISNFTPAGGGGNLPNVAYQEIARDHCADALDTSDFEEPDATLFGGAAAACLAALHGRGDLWPRAEAAADRLAATRPTLECWRQDMLDLLLVLVRLHRDDPYVQPVRQQNTTAAAGTSCPVILQISPTHGPPAGGQQVLLTGRRLPSTVVLSWGVTTLGPVSTRNGREVVVIVPASKGEEVAGVKVSEWPFEPLVTYSYDRAPSRPAVRDGT